MPTLHSKDLFAAAGHSLAVVVQDREDDRLVEDAKDLAALFETGLSHYSTVPTGSIVH